MDGAWGAMIHCSKTQVNCFLTIVVRIMLLSLPAPTTDGFHSQCGFSDCWDLYQLAQESLRISDIYPLTWVNKHSLPSASLMPAEIEKRCTAFRTFYKCLAMASRGCLGDLNFHSAHKGTEKQMNIYGCVPEGPVFEQQFSVASPIPLACTYNEGSDDIDFDPYHRVCGIFGDLHLALFDEEYQTCNIIGAWPMMDNEHFTVQVTAEKHHLGSILAKVTIVIKQDEECALADRYVLYQATSLEMPNTFSDGSTAFGAFDSIKLEEVEPSRHVAITMRHIDTTIWIHSIQQILSIFIKTPDEFANSLDAKLNSVQLCFMGCPILMQVNMQSFFKSAEFSDDAILKQSTLPSKEGKQLSTLPQFNGIRPVNYGASYFLCRSLEPSLKGYFLNSCIYDVMSSGDSSFAILSAVAMNTTVIFGGNLEEIDKFTEPNTRIHVSSACLLEPCQLLMMILLLCNMLNHSMNEVFTFTCKKSLLSLAGSRKLFITFFKNIISMQQGLLFLVKSLENLSILLSHFATMYSSFIFHPNHIVIRNHQLGR